MRPSTLPALAVALFIAADAPKDEVRGTWTIASIERDGKKEEKAIPLTFQDGKYTLTSAEGFTRSREGQYKLDPNASPKHITLVPSDGPSKGRPIMGIYRLEGDRLIACYDPSGAGRPMEFAARAGTGQVLVTYSRRGR